MRTWETRARALSCAVLFCGVALAFSGCKRESSGGGQKTVAVIPKSTSATYWQVVHAGAEKGGAESSVAIDWNGPAKETDTDVQLRMIGDMMAKGADAIVIAPQDAKALVEPIQNAHKKIPVIVMDSGVNTDDYTAFVATDNKEGGRMAARELVKLLGDTGGKVIMLRNDPGSASTMEREAGFEEVVKGTKLAVIDDQFHKSDPQAANRQALDMLLANPDAVAIFASNEPGTLGAINALRAPQNKQRHLHCVGFDSTETIADALHEGIIDGVILQDPFQMGELAVKAAAAALKGEKVEKNQPIAPTLATKANEADSKVAGLLRPNLSNAGTGK